MRFKTSKLTRRIAGVAAACAIAGVIAIGAAPAAQAAATSGDPMTTGCSIGSYTVKSWGVYNSKYGQYQATVELRYSPTCGTNWLRITNNVAGNKVWGRIETETSPIKAASIYAIGATQAWTGMVYAPGSTCVKVYADIEDRATGAIEGRLNYQRVC